MKKLSTTNQRLDAMTTLIAKLRQFLGDEEFQNFQDYIKVSKNF